MLAEIADLLLIALQHATGSLTLRFTELATDPLAGRSNQCPRCRNDLTEHVRAHLYRCTTVPYEVRLAAQAVRGSALRLVKQSQFIESVLTREGEALLFASQKALRVAMARRTAS